MSASEDMRMRGEDIVLEFGGCICRDEKGRQPREYPNIIW